MKILLMTLLALLISSHVAAQDSHTLVPKSQIIQSDTTRIIPLHQGQWIRNNTGMTLFITPRPILERIDGKLATYEDTHGIIRRQRIEIRILKFLAVSGTLAGIVTGIIIAK